MEWVSSIAGQVFGLSEVSVQGNNQQRGRAEGEQGTPTQQAVACIAQTSTLSKNWEVIPSPKGGSQQVLDANDEWLLTKTATGPLFSVSSESNETIDRWKLLNLGSLSDLKKTPRLWDQVCKAYQQDAQLYRTLNDEGRQVYPDLAMMAIQVDPLVYVDCVPDGVRQNNLKLACAAIKVLQEEQEATESSVQRILDVVPENLLTEVRDICRL